MAFESLAFQLFVDIGLISSNFFAKQKLTYSEKFVIQFHQHSALNCAAQLAQVCGLKFAKSVQHLPNLCTICKAKCLSHLSTAIFNFLNERAAVNPIKLFSSEHYAICYRIGHFMITALFSYVVNSLLSSKNCKERKAKVGLAPGINFTIQATFCKNLIQQVT